MPNIPIFLSSDNNYAPLVATTMTSILSNTKSFIEFYILDGGITSDNVEKIQSLKNNFNNFSIEFIKIDYEKYFKGFKTSGHWSKAVYARLLIPNLKPNINKAIFMDVDILVIGDIANLYNEDLENYALGAVWEDFSEQIPEHLTKIRKNMALNTNHKYFNSGVLLINCTRWRNENISSKLFKIADKYCDKIQMVDQDILNKCFDNNYKMLPKKYNYLTPYFWYDDEHKYLIRHLVGHVRPWQIKEDINTDLIPDLKTFWYYAKMTPFYKELTSKAATGIAAQKLLLTARVETLCYKEHFKKAQERSNNEHSYIFVQR